MISSGNIYAARYSSNEHCPKKLTNGFDTFPFIGANSAFNLNSPDDIRHNDEQIKTAIVCATTVHDFTSRIKILKQISDQMLHFCWVKIIYSIRILGQVVAEGGQ